MPEECQDPWPKLREGWAPGLRAVCGYWAWDTIHGPASDCEEKPCSNPDAHHDFVAPKVDPQAPARDWYQDEHGNVKVDA